MLNEIKYWWMTSNKFAKFAIVINLLAIILNIIGHNYLFIPLNILCIVMVLI